MVQSDQDQIPGHQGNINDQAQGIHVEDVDISIQQFAAEGGNNQSDAHNAQIELNDLRLRLGVQKESEIRIESLKSTYILQDLPSVKNKINTVRDERNIEDS